MEIVRETIASSGLMLKDKAMTSSIFPRRRRVRQRVGIKPPCHPAIGGRGHPGFTHGHIWGGKGIPL
jgi:hypothetical protein